MKKFSTTIYVAGNKIFLPTNNESLYGEEDWRQMWNVIQEGNMLNGQFCLKQIEELNPISINIDEIEILSRTVKARNDIVS